AREVICVWSIRLWKQRLDLQCDGIKSILGDNVSIKWIAVQPAIGRGLRRCRIVDHAFQHLPSEWIRTDDFRRGRYRLTEITASIGEGRYRLKLVVDVLRLAELLKVKKEERLVAAYRTTDRAAVIVSPRPRPGVLDRVVGERVPRVERFVHEIVVHRPMNLVGSGLHRDVKDTAAHLPILSGIIAGINCY